MEGLIGELIDELSGKLQLAQMDVDEIEIEEAEVDYSSLA